ncbi:carbohydrate ABC transporter permease [Pseudothermotoga sp.]
MRRLFKSFVIYFLLSVGAIVMIMPFAWMVSTSFKTRSEVERWPPIWTSKNFSRTWYVKNNVSRVSMGGLDWKGLTLREALVLLQQELEQNVLRIQIDDDPVHRGTVTVSFPPDAKFFRGKLDSDVFGEFANKLRETTKQKEVLQLLDESIDAEEFFSKFFALYLHGKDAYLDRRNYIDLVEKTINTAVEQIEILSRYVTRIPEEYRSQFLNFVESAKKICAEIVSSVTMFRKGKKAILDLTELEVLLKLLKNSLEQLSANALSESVRNNPVIRLYEQRVIDPIETVIDRIGTYLFVHNFFQSVQREAVESSEVKFKFMSERARKNVFSSMMQRMNIRRDLEIAVAEELKGPLEGLVERVEKRIDERFYSKLESLGVENVRIYTQQLKQSASQFLNLLKPKALNFRMFEDFSQLKQWLQQDDSVASKVTLSKLEQLAFGLNEQEFFKAFQDVCEEIETISQLRAALSRTQSLMELISAPDFVEEVRLKRNQTIELVLKDVHPVYLEDERYIVRVDYTFKEMLGNVFHNYVSAWKSAPFGIYYFNTVFVSTVTTLAEIVLCAMAAYAFALMNFPGKNIVFAVFLSTMMIPGEVLLVPNFITISKLGWIDTYYALIIPWIVSVFAIFLLRQHFLVLPKELQDAAKIDGCSHWKFLWTIVVPLSKPAIVTAALLKFVGSWNAFLWVLIVTNKDKFRTLPVGLQTFSTDVGTVYNLLMAAATFSILPILILFLLTQRYFVQGIARTGLK